MLSDHGMNERLLANAKVTRRVPLYHLISIDRNRDISLKVAGRKRPYVLTLPHHSERQLRVETGSIAGHI